MPFVIFRWGSFAVHIGDHLRRCTGSLVVFKASMRFAGIKILRRPIWPDEGPTLKSSAFKNFNGGNSTLFCFTRRGGSLRADLCKTKADPIRHLFSSRGILMIVHIGYGENYMHQSTQSWKFESIRTKYGRIRVKFVLNEIFHLSINLAIVSSY